MQPDHVTLIAAARAARKRAYCPYSKFRVGAAVLTASGAVFTAANVENAAYGLSVCAERNAIAQAVAAGEREIRAIAVIADGKMTAAPCGACRQVISEFGPDCVVIYRRGSAGYAVKRISELLPDAFSLRRRT